jgi:hypothetical protein
MDFGPKAKAMGKQITQDSLTRACQDSGDVSIVIGFSPTAEQAESALEQHLAQSGGRRLLMDPIRPASPPHRVLRRRRSRGKQFHR